jgi:hypothetical protein
LRDSSYAEALRARLAKTPDALATTTMERLKDLLGPDRDKIEDVADPGVALDVMELYSKAGVAVMQGDKNRLRPRALLHFRLERMLRRYEKAAEQMPATTPDERRELAETRQRIQECWDSVAEEHACLIQLVKESAQRAGDYFDRAREAEVRYLSLVARRRGAPTGHISHVTRCAGQHTRSAHGSKTSSSGSRRGGASRGDSDPDKPPPPTCLLCGRDISHLRGNAKYCTPNHGKQHRREIARLTERIWQQFAQSARSKGDRWKFDPDRLCKCAGEAGLADVDEDLVCPRCSLFKSEPGSPNGFDASESVFYANAPEDLSASKRSVRRKRLIACWQEPSAGGLRDGARSVCKPPEFQPPVFLPCPECGLPHDRRHECSEGPT